MKKLNFSKDNLPIILIILVGAFLRFYKIKDYIVFLGDQGRDVLVVYNILHGHLTLLGPTSSVGGFFLGPIYYYFMAPFLWLFNYDPVGPAIMVALFGLATIYLVYKLGSEFFGKRAGLTSALLYAVSPIVITYSNSSWNPNVFPFFTLATLYSLYKGITKNKPWLLVLSGVMMGINLQIHYLATFVGVIVFFYVLLSDFRFDGAHLKIVLKRYLSLLLGFLLGFSPFLLFEARHEFANTRHIIDFIFNSPDTGAGGQIFSNIEFVFSRLFGGLVLDFPALAYYHNFNPQILTFWYWGSILLGIVSVLFFLIVFVRENKKRESYERNLLILIWGLLGIGLFALYKKSIYDYYLGFLFPLSFLLVGLLLTNVAEKVKPLGKIIVGASLLGLVLLNLKFTPIAVQGNRQVNQMKTIAEFVLSKTDNKPFNFALITGGNSDHAYRYFMTLENHVPVTIQFPGVDPKRETVTDQLFVVCESLPCEPLGNSLWEVAGFGRAEIADHWKVSVVEVYKLIHYKGK